MKKVNLIKIIFILLLPACSINYYQVFKAESPSVKANETSLVYEDDNCKLTYNLWDRGGDFSFFLLNKTDQNLYLNLEESFFILNGVAFNYYQNRVYTYTTGLGFSSTNSVAALNALKVPDLLTGANYLELPQPKINTHKSTKAGTSTSVSTSKGYSITYNESKIVIIPSKTSKKISEYKVNQSVFRSCDLPRYPSSSSVRTLKYLKTNSPIIFSNRLTYKIGDDQTKKIVSNEFYVKEITNYPEKDMVEYINEENCGQKGYEKIKHFKNISPDKFYLPYQKSNDPWKF